MTKKENERYREVISSIDNLDELTNKMVEVIDRVPDYKDVLHMFIHRAYLLGIAVTGTAKDIPESLADEQAKVDGDFTGCIFAIGTNNITINNK